MVDILSMDRTQLRDYIAGLGEKNYTAAQLFDWLHAKRVESFSKMTNLSKTFREKLETEAEITSLRAVKTLRSSDGTVKFLFSMSDGNCVETVAMSYEHGVSVCVSSQAGCRMGCRFCASTGIGFARNLTASEILAQVYAVCRILDVRADSVVLMGIGEPLDNFDNVLRFCELITDEKGYGMSGRSLSLSTCGLVEGIRRLADMKKQLTLSVSLHAPTNEKRSRMMPINERYNIAELMEACRYYADTTGRRISYEYAVVHGVNDTAADAEELARLLRGRLAHVNLIPINDAGKDGYRASRRDAEEFRDRLLKLGLNATIRRTLGADIDAACGQLRRKTMETERTEGELA